MLKAKTDGVYEKIDKLATGLSKLVEARQQVETMNEELEVKKEDVAKKQRECDELMVVIAEKRMLADEQMKQVQLCQDVLGSVRSRCAANRTCPSVKSAYPRAREPPLAPLCF